MKLFNYFLTSFTYPNNNTNNFLWKESAVCVDPVDFQSKYLMVPKNKQRLKPKINIIN